MPEFVLRFPLEELRTLAERNAQPEDLNVQAAGLGARARGFYTRAEFLVVSTWKCPGIRAHREENNEEIVQEVTRTAFASTDERERIARLQDLSGVSWPSASVLLHWGHADPYPVLEPRVLWGIGVDRVPRKYDFKFWVAYVTAFRRYLVEAESDRRTLDRALWQFWKEQH